MWSWMSVPVRYVLTRMAEGDFLEEVMSRPSSKKLVQ